MSAFSIREDALSLFYMMRFIQALILFVILLHYPFGECYAVVLPPDNARITVVKGGSSSFIFNAMDKYVNGIALENWTELRIVYVDEVPIESTGWRFTISAVQTEINMSGGTPFIPLDHMTFRVVVDDVFDFGEFTLTNAPTEIFSDVDFVGDPFNASHKVMVSYRLGVPPNLVSAFPSGFYYVDLSFDLLVKL
jgi:hypothetical protein